MALTKFQIDEIKKRAKAQGFTDSQVEASMAEIVSQFDASQGLQPTPKITAPSPTTPTVPTAKPTQSTQQVMGASAPMSSTPTSPTPQPSISTSQQPSQPQNTSLVGNFFKSLYNTVVDPAVNYGKFVGEAAAQTVRFASDPAFRNVVTGNADKVSYEDLQRIGSENPTYYIDPNKVQDTGSIIKTGVKATAGAASLAVPGGAGAKGMLAAGAASGALYGISEGDTIDPQKVVQGAAGGAAGAAAFPIAGSLLSGGKTAANRVINKMLNPFTAQYDDEIVKLAVEKGVDLPVSARTNSNVVKQLEAWAQKSFFGGKVTERIVNARDTVDNLAQDLTNKLAKDVDKKAIGETVKNSFTSFENAFNKTKTELYNSVPDSIIKVKANTDTTLSALEQIIASKEESAAPNTNVEYYKTILKNLTEGKDANELFEPTYSMLKKTRTSIGEKMKNFSDPIATGDMASLKKLYASLSDDLEETIKIADPNGYKLLEKANAFYRDGLIKINSTIGKTIKNADPEKLLDTLLKPNSETDIKLVKSMMDKEAIGKLQEGFTNKIYNQSLDSKQVLDVKKLRNNLAKYGESSIRELLGDTGFSQFNQTLVDLEDIGKLQSAIQRGVKPAEGSQTAFLLNQAANLGIYTLNPTIAISKIGGEMGIVRLLTSESGQKFLTEGLGEIAEKSGVKLNSSIESIVGRLISLQTARMSAQNSGKSTSGEFVAQNNQINSDGSLSAKENIGTEKQSQDNNFLHNDASIPQQDKEDTSTLPFGGRKKEELLQMALADGLGAKELEEIAKIYDMVVPKSASLDVDTLLTQREKLSNAGFDTTKIDTQLLKLGFSKMDGAGNDQKTDNQKKFGPAVTRALKQMETISGLGSDDSIFQGGSTTLGKKIKNVGIASRKSTDATFAQKVNQYSSSLQLVVGAINQMLGAGTLNEGEAQRLLDTMPNEYTSETDAKAWFDNSRIILGVE